MSDSDLSLSDFARSLAKPNTTLAYTDGACKNNPGKGGWGAWLIFGDGTTQEIFGGELETTNNRMELTATIQAILHSPAGKIEIWTDSQYVQKGITTWMEGWRKKQFKKIKNPDLWQQLDKLNQERDIQWHWIKGHAGHLGNEKADQLANLGVAQLDNPQSTPTQSTKDLQIDPQNNQTELQSDWLNDDVLGLNQLDSDTFWETDNETDNKNILEDEPNTQWEEPPLQTDNQPQTTNNEPSDKPNEPAVLQIDTSRADTLFQPILPIPKNKNHPERQLIMDTETTGLDLTEDRIIEIGMIELVGRKFTGEKLHVYLNPERPVPEESLRVHGIHDEFLKNKPKFAELAERIFEFMDGAELIAHNANFDVNFLKMEFEKVYKNNPDPAYEKYTHLDQHIRVTDNLEIAKRLYPGQRNSLDALVRRLGVGKQDRTFHGALLDSEILAEVYLTMTGGQVALAIDDQAEQGQNHNFHHKTLPDLANLLIASPTDEQAHQDWIKALKEKYPQLDKTAPNDPPENSENISENNLSPDPLAPS